MHTQKTERKRLVVANCCHWRCSVTAFVLSMVLFPLVAESQMRSDFKPRKVLRRPKQAIVNPKIVLAGKTATPLRDDELVLGVVVAGAARAYPINMLTGPSREIINDRLGGRDIAATW